MKCVFLSVALFCSALGAPASLAVHADTGAIALDDKPINAMCPIGKEAIVSSAGTIEYKGHTIGLCCPGCGKAFLAWEEMRRDEFVELALAGNEPGRQQQTKQESKQQSESSDAASVPYPIDTCIVAGAKLGSMGDPVIKSYDGREVRFCCAACIDKFEADKAGYFKKLDDMITKDQLRYYPTQTCVVMGDALVEDGKDIAINVVHQNRLVRLCCRMCVRSFNENPAKYIAQLDKLAADAQRTEYPMETCIVAGSQLGSMGDPTEMVVAGRLLRFCCASCHPKVEADPMKYIAAIDAAWKAKGKYQSEAGKN